LVRRIDLHDDRLEITICLDKLLPAGDITDIDAASEPAQMRSQLHCLSVPVSKLRRGCQVRLVIAAPQDNSQIIVDPALVRLIASAQAARAEMNAAGDFRIIDVAKAQGFTNNYFTLLLRLATLDPGIVHAVLEGRQPVSLTRQRLANITNLPIDWVGQRAALGFL
jgi:site-specific DNA recombinase